MTRGQKAVFLDTPVGDELAVRSTEGRGAVGDEEGVKEVKEETAASVHAEAAAQKQNPSNNPIENLGMAIGRLFQSPSPASNPSTGATIWRGATTSVRRAW